MPLEKFDLLNYIKTHHNGRDSAVTLSILKNVFHQKDDRKLRKTIKELNQEGHRILTCSSGVYFSTSDDDFRLYKGNLKKRIFALWRDLKAIDEIEAREVGKQMEMFG